jgi:flagellar motility protein MotE (MotC chaperone)
MIITIPTPRLLPATITAMAALLLLKGGILTLALVTHNGRPDSAMVAVANAASTERSADPAPERPKAPSSPQAPIAATAPAAPETPPPVSASERALLQDLRQRRQQLDIRADAVKARESVLTATEQKLAARVTELQALQKKLEGLDAAQKQKEETGWQGLVKLYEAMKPKDAATIFNDLQMPVLIQVIGRMKDAKAAAVMAAMTPDRARDVTAELAQMRTGGPSAAGNGRGGTEQAGGGRAGTGPAGTAQAGG